MLQINLKLNSIIKIIKKCLIRFIDVLWKQLQKKSTINYWIFFNIANFMSVFDHGNDHGKNNNNKKK